MSATAEEIVDWCKAQILMKDDWLKSHSKRLPDKVEGKRYSRRALLAIVHDIGKETLEPGTKYPKVSELIDWCDDEIEEIGEAIHKRKKDWPENEIETKRRHQDMLRDIRSLYRAALSRRRQS